MGDNKVTKRIDLSGTDELLERQKKDGIKRTFCKKKNIPLLEIPYWDYDNIETILEDFLCKEKNVVD